MIWNELISLLLLFCLGLICSVSDIKKGYIYNRVLLIFLGLGTISTTLYYVFFARDLFLLFCFNLLLVTVCSLVLFYTHTFAGGDTKLLIVMSILFPGRFYIKYGDSQLTLLFALCFAILYGYLFLLFSSIISLIKKKTVLSKEYIKSYLLMFVKSYIVIMPYVILLTLVVKLITVYAFNINTFIEIGLCFILAWSVNKVKLLKRWYILCPVVTADIILSIVLKVFPISLHPGNYVFTLLIVLFQMTIRTGIYKEIKTEDIKAGMILSTATSLLMQNSRVRNMPGISKEDLRDRLTEEQANSVRRWGTASTGQDTVCIMRKIPFAIFITMGYLSYLVLWGVLL